MNNFAKSLLAVSVAAAAFGSTAALAEVSANVGATSNYLWRGATQAGEGAAVSGGIDYANESGFYVGGWTSNESWTAAPGYELDVYAGYGGEVSGISYDLGAITYLYPVGDGEDDFSEFYVNLGFGALSASVAYTFSKESDLDTGDIYASLGGSFDVKEGLSAGVLAGSYTFADDALEDFDYTHFQASLTKSLADYGDVTFALDKTSMDEDFWGEGTSDPRISVSWSKSFDL
jgi:uncharacterized protein (TIGR02001 family)